MIESICVFGSFARGTSDSLSDRDVLIVCSESEHRIRIQREWENDGWSVSSFTPNRFKKMACAGSLFVHHINLEGVILHDRENWLASELRNAQRKTSYLSDADKSIKLAQPIERFFHEAFIGKYPTVADLAYVALRNFGVCLSAEQKRLTFDYVSIAQIIGDEFDFSLKERDLIISLREMKHLYRSNSKIQTSVQIRNVTDILSKVFRRRFDEIDPMYPLRGKGYALVRDFEARMNSQNLLCPPPFDKLISAPQDYSWDVRNVSLVELERVSVLKAQRPIITSGYK